MRYQVKGEPDALLKQIRTIIAAPPSQEGSYDARFFALQAAMRFFPEESKDIFENYRTEKAAWTRDAKMEALREPTDPQPWMKEFLASLLDDTTETYDGYGPSWDWQTVRVCDQAAKILADDYLPKSVRFEFEESPAYLTGQIQKIRRVLAGEKNVTFGPPPVVTMPKDLPTRKATRVVELNADFGPPYAISSGAELWFGHGFYDGDGWAYETVKFDVAQGKVVARIPLNKWEGGVNILKNGTPDRSYCYHGYGGGDVLIRDLVTGKVLKKVETPFHAGIKFDDPLKVRNLGDITLCGKESRWILALTDDLKLHSVDTLTGEHRIEWKYKWTGEENEFSGFGHVIGIQNSSIALLEDVGEQDGFFNAPLQIWDQQTRTMKVFEKTLSRGWQGGWGNLAWNVCGEATVWNLATFRQVPI
ncbi:MAG: hypothetical protein KDA84_18400, partial [Planctomycetaceae bacterium]|nr:hypothetical protein [Planctomycetaceae bacterium]